MRRFDCLRVLADLVGDDLVIIGISGVNWEWRTIHDEAADLTIGSLGQTAGVGCGLALALPERDVTVFESDGSSLFDLPALTAISACQPRNLRVFVFDNELYSGSRISQPSATGTGADLALMARGAGIEQATSVRDLEAFEREARTAFTTPGPHYVVAKVERDDEVRRLPKPRMDYMENMYRFVRHVERLEGREILPELR